MQGYILNVRLVRDEDLIVTILTSSKVLSAYRFYGARHSQINIGYKIDFAIEYNLNNSLGRLKDIVHIGCAWLIDLNKILYWQQFTRLISTHLYDVTNIDNFYLKGLDEASDKAYKQDMKRVVIEFYIKLLEHEGRLHNDFVCFVCDKFIENDLAMSRAFLPSHHKCSYGLLFDKNKIKQLFLTKDTFYLSDKDIESYWSIITKGI
jgi:recombinational DNA repair protein (RecF pathway)